MADVGDRVVQMKSPGVGWVKVGERNDVNIWEFRGASTTSGGDGGDGDGGSGGSSGSGDAEADARARQRYKDAYQVFMDPTGKKKFKVPAKMLDLAVKNKWSLSTMYLWIRQHDPQYLESTQAKELISRYRTMVASIFGPAYKITKGNKIYSGMIAYAKLPPNRANNASVVMSYFKQYIMPSNKFKEMFPLFAAWLKSNVSAATGALAGLNTPSDFVSQYTKLVAMYTSAYKNEGTGIGNVDAAIPESLLLQAMRNNWSLDGIEWQTAVRNTSAYLGSSGAEARRIEFESNWERMFVGTTFENSPPDPGLTEQYVKSNMNFTQFFNVVMNKPGSASAQLIAEAFPSYASFIKNNPSYLSGQLDLFGEGGYFDRRAAFIDYYKQMLEDPEAVPSQDLLDKALAGAWSDAQYQLYVKENDVGYLTAPSSQAKLDTLERYWEALFGPSTPVDETVSRKWLLGQSGTPADLLGDIQELPVFKERYPDYRVFQEAQVKTGGGELADPALYKEFESVFDDVFIEEGLDPTQFSSLKTQYFGAGIKPEEFRANMTQWSDQKTVFKITTGQTPSMEVVAGIAKPEQGGRAAGADIRKRLEQEFQKYRTFTQTPQQAAVKVEEENNQYVQKI